ncbi:hypothetical protein NDU88_003615 [Pleurodeles waltl]|uniref:Uncharacterized protein n=1 Tax=Pleurodeles waltl TaxID=8319 RepID=A0AAV7T5B9_PLEWA|nr:hypothetical protein NDU88_003615 [Pleurodeles waltl]
MTRNRKAALQTGGGSPPLQEDLDEMEEMVAAIILEEIITEDNGSPVDLSVLDYPDDLNDQLTTISKETIQDVLGTLQAPPPVSRRSTHVAAIPEDPPTTPIVRPASSNTAENSDDTGTTFERTVVGVQRELAKEVRMGMQTMAASLEGMHMCKMTSAE